MPGIRVTKPFKLGLLHRAYQYRGEKKLAVSMLAMLSLTEAGRILSEPDMWRRATTALGRDGMLDAAMPKSRGEFLLNGSFHAPGGKAAPAGYVRVKLGKLDKRINVYGDRHWKRAAGVSLGVSDPAPMDAMPLDYAHAFGGKEHKPNPVGKGIEAEGPEGEERVTLPNLELPGALIGSPSDRPPPACYGPLDPMWPQRYAKVGTYDQKWLKERAPGYADDLQWSYFNVTAEDQWLEGYWRGDEEFELHNLHPTQALIQGKLPALMPRAFVVHGHGEGGRFEELPTRLDTVHFFPGQDGAVCIWRADTAITTDDASDVSQILLAYENLRDPRRSAGHYQEALKRRLVPKTRAMLLLDERDLIPEGDKSGMAELIERSVEDSGRENLLAKNQGARMQAEMEKTRGRLKEQGLEATADLLAPKPADKPFSIEGADVVQLIEDARKQSEDSREIFKSKLAEACKQAGLDLEEVLRKAAAALPRFSAVQQLAKVRQLVDASPAYQEMVTKAFGAVDFDELEAKLKAAEEGFRKGYGMGAHAAVTTLPADRQAGLKALREDVLQRLKRGESLARMDLAGVDLKGVDLRGADLSGAYLEFADFSGADLTGARLQGAIAPRSNFSGAKLGKADFSTANVGKSSFVGAKGEGADFSNAVLSESSFENSAFPGARFASGQALKVNFSAADLSGAEFHAPVFMDCILDGARLNRAKLQRSIVMGGSGKALDLGGATGTAPLFVNVNLDGIKLGGAEIAKLRLVGERTSARGGDFNQAKLPGSNLRGLDLEGANFEGAVLDGSELSESKLKNSRFRGASAQRAHFMKTDLEKANLSNCNLKEAFLNKARLVQADLSGSNCFGAEFLGVVVGETRFHGANLKRTKLKDWHP